jgi:WD40-like Beta Propeller Repeat
VTHRALCAGRLFFTNVTRLLLASIAAALLLAAPANAVLVYQQGGEGHDAPIVAARNDGTDTRLVAHGFAPSLSPSGHRVAYLRRGPDAYQLYVVGNRGLHRHRVAFRVFDTGPFPSIAWSPDDRYLIVADPHGGAHLVDVRKRTSRHVKAGGDYGGASFTPDCDEFAICGIPGARGSDLREVDLKTLAHRSMGDGCSPIWGRRGLAFERPNRLLFREHIGDRAEALLHRHAFPIDWSADGARLLAYEQSPMADHPLLIDLSPRHLTQIHEPIFPRDLSRNGQEILGESDGDIVVRKSDGTLQVLAASGVRPSWTK